MNKPYSLDYMPNPGGRTDYRIGIIGAGFIVKECQLPAYMQAGYQVVGLASRTAEIAKEVAVQFNLPKIYENVDELLSDPEIDAVDIAVPPHEQLHIVRKAAGHGKHILAQKPLAMNYETAKEIVRICDQAQVKLVVNQNGRFDPAIMAAKHLLEKGYVG